jgi:hypothetical protein
MSPVSTCTARWSAATSSAFCPIGSVLQVLLIEDLAELTRERKKQREAPEEDYYDNREDHRLEEEGVHELCLPK